MNSPGGEDLPTVSVVVLNHRRPHLLERALTALALLDYPAFEIVVVGDQPDIAGYGMPDWLAGQIRYSCFTEPNICKARNIAIQMAQGNIVAFIDDDAVPEPGWLTGLTQPFARTDVAVVGGTVRASDGVSIEWQGGTFDRAGTETPLMLTQDITILTAGEQLGSNRFLSLRGVNTAFRRTALLQAGGFDEAIRYYLDETDMALRLVETGWSSAITRNAEVHHLLVPNATRGLLRKPADQHEIGAAKAIFCRKHLQGDLETALSGFVDQRRNMLDPQMRLGIVREADCKRMRKQLEAGFADGLSRQSVCPLISGASSDTGFSPFRHSRSEQVLDVAVDTGWSPTANTALSRLARKLADAGHRVSIFSFRSGPHPLKVTFRDGMWQHTGGTWSLPAHDAASPAISRAARARTERQRITRVRGFDVILRARTSNDGPDFIELPGSRQKVTILQGDRFSGDSGAIRLLLQSVADGELQAENPPDHSIARPETDTLHRIASTP